MILVDTSVWIQHLRAGEEALSLLLAQNRVSIHPFVIGELACGNLSRRSEILKLLSELPRAREAINEEVLYFIEKQQLMGKGMGYVDLALLAATRITPGTRLWTLDRRLAAAAAELGIAYNS